MRISAVIPVKGFANAKQRLRALLSPMERDSLAELMFRHVLNETVKARQVSATYVVTASDKVAGIAESLGANVIRERAETGETSAVDCAREYLKQTATDAVLIIPADLPLIRSTDIDELVSDACSGAAVPFAVLVPSHDRMGTNAVLLAPPDVIGLRFGYDSFAYHVQQVLAAGLPLRVLENERIALDIDEPKDFEKLLTFANETGPACCLARDLARAQRLGSKAGADGL